MENMTDKQVVSNALRIVNRVRKACGSPPLDDLPLGRKKRQLTCPIANALPGKPSVGWNAIWFVDEKAAQELAAALGTVVIRSGNGQRKFSVSTTNTTLSVFPRRFDQATKTSAFWRYRRS